MENAAVASATHDANVLEKERKKGNKKECASLTWMDAAVAAAQVAAKKRKNGKSLCQHSFSHCSQNDNGEAGKGRMMCARNTGAFLFSFSCAHQKRRSSIHKEAGRQASRHRLLPTT